MILILKYKSKEIKVITIETVESAYIKLKGDIYYSNNIIYKEMIASFECHGNMRKTFKIVANIYNGNAEIAEEYISQISIYTLPKKVDIIDDGYNKNNKKIYGLTENIRVESVNFFIKAPIVIFLLDVLWTLEIGRVSFERGIIDDDVVYGNVLSSYKLYEAEINNTTFFEPYFYKYSKWRNNAFSKIKELNKEYDLLLINYDIKQYYYNYQVNFEELMNYLGIDRRYEFGLIQKIYSRYKDLLSKYKKLKNYEKRYPLPIGLYSSRIISNIALSKYDSYVKNSLDNKGYYGRYVDDMIIVCPFYLGDMKASNKMSIQDIIKNTLPFLEIDENCHIPYSQLNLYGNKDKILLEIQMEKTDIYYFKKDSKNLMSKIYQNKILMRASDIGYFIDEDITEKKLINDLFRYKNSKYLNKISDLKTTSIDKYELSLTLTKLLNFYKNVSLDEIENSKNNVAEMLINFLSNGEGIKYYQQWEKLFYLLNTFGLNYVCKYFNQMNDYIKNEIKFSLDCKEYAVIHELEEMTKYNIQLYLHTAKDISISINKLNIKNKWFNSMMVNKNIISRPLYLMKKNVKSNYQYDIDWKKIKYLPYWVSFEELYLYISLQNILGNIEDCSLDEMIDKYCKINRISKEAITIPKSIKPFNFDQFDFLYHKFETITEDGKIVVNLLNQIPRPKQGIDEDKKEYLDRLYHSLEKLVSYSEYKIGLASIPLDLKIIEKNVKSKKQMNSIEYKYIINHILNEAINNKVDHLIFPELSIPLSWVKDLMFFSKRHGIQLTFGLQYFYNKKKENKGIQIYNCICSLYPFRVCGVYTFMYCDMREKRFYPYKEKEMFENNKLLYNNNSKKILELLSLGMDILLIYCVMR